MISVDNTVPIILNCQRLGLLSLCPAMNLEILESRLLHGYCNSLSDM